MDSLGAVEFRNALSRKLGVKLSATTLFDYPTLNAIVEHVCEVVDATHEAPVAVAALKQRRTDGGMAIMSMACRFPGGSDCPDNFWDMMCCAIGLPTVDCESTLRLIGRKVKVKSDGLIDMDI